MNINLEFVVLLTFCDMYSSIRCVLPFPVPPIRSGIDESEMDLSDSRHVYGIINKLTSLVASTLEEITETTSKQLWLDQFDEHRRSLATAGLSLSGFPAQDRQHQIVRLLVIICHHIVAQYTTVRSVRF